MDNSIKQNQMRYTRILILSFFLLQFLFQFCYGQKEVVFPPEFPSDLIGKKLCGTISTTGKSMQGYTAFLDVPFELFVSKDFGIYARYNPGDKFGQDKWGSTPIISSFVLWKTSDSKDKYGDLIGRTYYYKTPSYDVSSKHNIESFSIYNFFGSDKNPPSKSINLHVFIPSYESGSISSFYKTTYVCEILVSQAEIKAKKNADDEKRCLLIDQLYLEKKIEAAKNEMDKLNYPQSYKKKKTIEAEYLLFVKAQLDREALEDLTNINNIRILLNSSDIEKVVQLWTSLHSKTNLQNIKDSIFQFIVRNETGNIPISLAISDLTKFIELNKVQIGNSYKSITKDTNIIIQFDQLGKCLQKESYLWNSSVFKKYSDEFFTYQSLKIPVSLKIKDAKIENKDQVFYSGSNKNLAISSSGRNFYQYNYFTKPILIESNVIEYTFNKNLPSNEVTTGVFWGHEVYANNTKISTIEIEKQFTSKIKKRIFRIVGRSVVFATTLSLLGLISIL